MPLEIRELVIKAVVGDKTSDSSTAGLDQAPTGENNTDPQQILVNTCVEQVLTILKEKSER